jgi:hypothetical protein
VIDRYGRAVLCTLLCALACRRTPAPPLLPGAGPHCYRLVVGPWKIPENVRVAEQRFVPPTPRLLLFDTARTSLFLGVPLADSPWRRLRGQSPDTAWGAFERAQPLRGWRVEGDSLFTAFTTPFGGLGMDFRIAGDSVLGKAEVTSDMGGLEFPTAPAVGQRVSCPPA